MSFYGTRLLSASGKINTSSKSRCQLPTALPGSPAAEWVEDSTAGGGRRILAGTLDVGDADSLASHAADLLVDL